jgi:hypothetical protein
MVLIKEQHLEEKVKYNLCCAPVRFCLVQVRDLLSKLPGISSRNIFALLNKCENLVDLISLPQVGTIIKICFFSILNICAKCHSN